MIFNFPTQTRQMLEEDLSVLLKLQADQITYYPLMVSASTQNVMGKKLGIAHWLLQKREQPVFLWSFPGALFPAFRGRLFFSFCALLLFSRERIWIVVSIPFSNFQGLVRPVFVSFSWHITLFSGFHGSAHRCPFPSSSQFSWLFFRLIVMQRWHAHT